MVDGHTSAGPARIAHGHRLVLLVGRGQELAALVFIGRTGQRHIGDTPNIGNVISTRVRGPVGTDQAGAVERKDHGQIL